MRRYMTPYTIGNYFADDGGAVFAQLDVRGDRRFDVAVWIYAERGRMVCDASTPGGRFIRYGTFSRGDGNIVGCQVGVGYFSKSNVRWRVAAGRDGWGWDSAPNYGSFYSYI